MIYYRLLSDYWTRVGRDEAINVLRGDATILVMPDTISPATHLALSEGDRGVQVSEIAKNVFEITAPDATTLDTVYHSAAEALDQAEMFLVPLPIRLTGMAEGLREVEAEAKADDHPEQAALFARFAHDLERILAHYRYEQVKRGEGDQYADLKERRALGPD